MTYSPELLSAVAVLDKDQPGWWRKVDLEKYHHADCAACVIGQVYGCGSGNGVATADFRRERSRLFPHAGETMEVPDGTGFHAFFDYGEYGTEWRSLIAERQSADRIGETLSIPDLESQAVEGHERVLA
jgi:hypothetical protein